ncbi:MAG TPA: hypothetical protein VGR47_21255 [Terracidiphilus sp.]|nr:hypothetical protein [Terracidiphilus sp.]
MHERLRLELLRRIDRGTLSVSLLARQTGYTKAHLSHFLRRHRQLSLEAMDRVLASQLMGVADLMPVSTRTGVLDTEGIGGGVPLVSPEAALFEPVIRPSAVKTMVRLSAGSLRSVRASHGSESRRQWHRFVAVRIPPAEARPMEPVVFPEAIVLLDRHYFSLAAYRPNRPNIYAVRHRSRLLLRYVDHLAGQIVLRPHNLVFPVDLIQLQEGQSPGDLLAGRVVLILNEP